MPGGSEVSLAVDLGASSGRVVAGLFDGRVLQLQEVHRFENGGVHASGRLYWDLLRLWNETLQGMLAASKRYSDRVRSVGVDTWGVDFGLLGEDGLLLSNPFHYRDGQTEGTMEASFGTVSRKEIFASTGIQFLPFNTLYQLIAMREANSTVLQAGKQFMMIPDLFHWLMTGVVSNEQTNASTTQCYNPTTKRWELELLQRFEIPTESFGEILEPGTVLGKLKGEVAQFTNLEGLEVVLPGTHDTASAVMAVPAAGGAQADWCYISSGTWSLMGVETTQPIINERVEELNFTNEGGVAGTTRLLKNIAGMWLIQECRRVWQLAGQSYDWEQLIEMANKAPALVSLVDPDHPSFMAPEHMPTAIRRFCEHSSQPQPESPGAVVRCALESLALRYRAVLGWLEELVGYQLNTIHIVGGGSQNELLCQMAADACGRTVVAGPVEATAIGNVMMQNVARGRVGSISEARDVIRSSFAVKRFEPQNSSPWDEAYGRFQALLKASV